jgi:hypothetical protein
MLPIDEQPPDTALRIYQAIQTIAGVEDRSITGHQGIYQDY